jgi:hypothetical protein
VHGGRKVSKPTCGTFRCPYCWSDSGAIDRSAYEEWFRAHYALTCKGDIHAIREECDRELRQEHMRDDVRNGERTADGRAVKDGGI